MNNVGAWRAWLLVCAVLLGMGSLKAAERVDVLEYYTAPPFVIDRHYELGLSYDLARLLTEMSEGRYNFIVDVIPRPRLDQRLTARKPGVVFWANPKWFGDAEKTRYQWTGVLLRDSNSVISPRSNPIEYTGAESLVGKDLVGIRGYYYTEVDPFVESGMINRVDVNSEEAAVKFVANGRADVTMFSETSARYFAKKFQLENFVHFSLKNHSDFERFILVQPFMPEVFDYVNSVVSTLPENEKWQEIISGYGLAD